MSSYGLINPIPGMALVMPDNFFKYWPQKQCAKRHPFTSFKLTPSDCHKYALTQGALAGKCDYFMHSESSGQCACCEHGAQDGGFWDLEFNIYTKAAIYIEKPYG